MAAAFIVSIFAGHAAAEQDKHQENSNSSLSSSSSPSSSTLPHLGWYWYVDQAQKTATGSNTASPNANSQQPPGGYPMTNSTQISPVAPPVYQPPFQAQSAGEANPGEETVPDPDLNPEMDH